MEARFIRRAKEAKSSSQMLHSKTITERKEERCSWKSGQRCRHVLSEKDRARLQTTLHRKEVLFSAPIVVRALPFRCQYSRAFEPELDFRGQVAINRNRAQKSGGGIYVEAAKAITFSCLLCDQNISPLGGALAIVNCEAIRISGSHACTSSFTNNVAVNGGAFYVYQSNAEKSTYEASFFDLHSHLSGNFCVGSSLTVHLRATVLWLPGSFFT